MLPADLARRLAAHGLTLTAGERTTHGYTARWRLDGLGEAAWFGTLAEVERWADLYAKDTTMDAATLTFGSLFAGIGGIDLGLERAGMRCAWQVEIDDYATRVLTKHWPHVARFRDVRECGRHNLAPVDVLAGGFPCQDISNAGKRAGLSGERSGLWREFARLIGELRPRYVLVENVAALLGRGMDVVLGDLSTFGYDAEWQIIPAAAVGAPHLRERVFIAAYTQGRNGRAGLQPDQSPEIGWRRSANSSCAPLADADSSERRAISEGRYVFDGHDSGRQETASGLSAFRQDAGSRQWAIEPPVGRMADGVPRRVDRLRGLGNAVVPQLAEFVGRCIVAHAEQLELFQDAA